MRTRIVVLTLLVLAPAGIARAAGGYPFGAEAGPEGVVTPTSTVRYVTIASGTNTVLERIQRAGGQVLAERTLHGPLGIPAVATDGTAGGLSANGGTLVLIRPLARFPVAETPLRIVDTRTLHVSRISLKGTFAFDAVSPDGRSLYLTQYPTRDVNRYVVRRFDVARGDLQPGAIVDRRNPAEQMRGVPLTRITSSGGRWAYTLYDGAGHEPFIHALDTSSRRAFCIDLGGLEGSPRLYSLRLVLGQDGLRVVDRDETVATVDTTTFRVVTGAPPALASSRPGSTTGGHGGGLWLALAGAIGVIALGFATVRLTRRRQSVVSR